MEEMLVAESRVIAADCVKKRLNSSHYLKINMIEFADGFTSSMILRFSPKELEGGIAVSDMERLVVIVVVVSAGGWWW